MDHEYSEHCGCMGCQQQRNIGKKAAKHPNECQCRECWERLEAEKNAPQTKTKPPPQTVLVSFESGHYKKVTGKWKGDSIWTHWEKPNGKTVHINKDKVEYYEEL